MELSNKKSVLITGAGGFIGLNVVKAFVNNGEWDICALVHRNIPESLEQMPNVCLQKGDVTSEEAMSNLFKEDQFDVVVHIAGLASDIGSDTKFRKINFEPVKFLSKFAKKKFIYLSSTDVYGIKDFINADESTELCEFPKNPYPRYKIKSEEWLRENCKKSYVIIRPAAVYGENDKTLEKRIVEFLESSPFIVHFGKWKGKNRWPLANVKNVANVILATSLYDDYDNQAINIIDPEVISIDSYYRKVANKYFPEKQFKTITLPFWFGKLLGIISTTISSIKGSKEPIFDPTFYAVHHVSSNLDFSSEKMIKVLDLLKQEKGRD